MSTPYYYKSLNTLTNQGMHNLLQFLYSRVMRSSNLTFGGYLADTTLILSVRSSLFVLYKCCYERARTVWLTDNFSTPSMRMLNTPFILPNDEELIAN